MSVVGIKSTGGCSFSTESLFAFFAEGFLVDDTFNLYFCTNDFAAFGVCSEWPFSLLETSFSAFVVPFSDVNLPFSGSDEDVDDDNEDDNVNDDDDNDDILMSFSACSIV